MRPDTASKICIPRRCVLIHDVTEQQAYLTPELLLDQYEAFLREAIKLRDRFSHQIALLIGIETDWITDLDSQGTTGLLSKHPEIDYVVGSVHHLKGVPIDFDRSTWIRAIDACVTGETSSSMRAEGGKVVRIENDISDPKQAEAYEPTGAELEAYFVGYFEAQYDMLRAHQPDVIGHFDLCRLYTPNLSLKSYPSAWDLVRRNVEYGISYGALFEANSSAFRKGWKTSYPSREILDAS